MKLEADRKDLERQRRELEDAKVAHQKRDLALVEEKQRVERWALDERAKLERWAEELSAERERAFAALNAAAQRNPPPLVPLAEPAWGQGGHGAPPPHQPPHPLPAAPSSGIADRYCIRLMQCFTYETVWKN